MRLRLWICVQQAPQYKNKDNDAYWTERLNQIKNAGTGYWKIDWVEDSKSAEWRTSPTRLGKQVAPNLIIEHAMTPSVMATAEVNDPTGLKI